MDDRGDLDPGHPDRLRGQPVCLRSAGRIVPFIGTQISVVFQGAVFVSFAFGPTFTTGALTHLFLGFVPALWAAWRVASDV